MVLATYFFSINKDDISYISYVYLSKWMKHSLAISTRVARALKTQVALALLLDKAGRPEYLKIQVILDATNETLQSVREV